MTPTRLSIAAATLAVLALLVVGLVELGGTSGAKAPASGLTLAQMRSRLAGSPPALSALHAQSSEILGGGLAALDTRLASLRGTPIVINKWASWCEPCRAEFGVFQRVAVSDGRRVAFLGIDSGESRAADARTFLRSFPVAYPSYYDHSGKAGLAITDSSFTPVTVFYNRAGGEYIHQGPYPSVAKLEADISRYALGS
jgi:thiol-disulfide isomerase/thioredoxin